MELFNILTSFCNKYGYAYSVNHDSGNGCSCKVFRIVFDSDVDDFMHIGMLLGYYTWRMNLLWVYLTCR